MPFLIFGLVSLIPAYFLSSALLDAVSGYMEPMTRRTEVNDLLSFQHWVLLSLGLAAFSYVVAVGVRSIPKPAWVDNMLEGGDFAVFSSIAYVLILPVTVYFVVGYFMNVFLIHLIALIPFFLLTLLSFVYFVLIGVLFYPFIAGLIYIFTTAPGSAALAKREATTRKSRAEVEKELASLMEQELRDDARVANILSNLNPFERWVKTIKYRRWARQLEKVRRLQEHQLDTLRKRSQIGKNALEIEREKRNDL